MKMEKTEERKEYSTLTERELEVCLLLTKGFFNYEQIAANLCVSVNTLKSHLDNIYSKLQIHSIKELIYYLMKKDSDYSTHINKKLEQKTKELEKIKNANKKAIEILCAGRTFYHGYFDNPEKLSRIDKAIYVLFQTNGVGK